MKDNFFRNISDPKALQEVAQEIQGNPVQQRINYWMDRFLKKESPEKSRKRAGRERADDNLDPGIHRKLLATPWE